MSTERVGIIVELEGAENAISQLTAISKLISRLNKQKIKIDLGNGQQIKGLVTATKQVEKLGAQTTQTQAKVQTLGQSMRTTFNQISSVTMHAGQQMQVLGKTLTQISSPFRSLFRSTVFAAGFKALNLVTAGFSNTFARMDTMDTYDKSLKALKSLGIDVDKTFSIAGKDAKTAKDNLDDAVQGLPTSLDEIMAAQKVYAGATGEMEKSTKTAIAANNAYLASNMASKDRRNTQRYLAALASGAELTSNQWESMSRTMPMVMRTVSKELGYADQEFKQFKEDVRDGTVSGEKFLKAFMKVGTSGDVANAARVTAQTWSGLASNVQIAFTRMGANITGTINSVFEKATDRNILQLLLGQDAKGNDLGDGVKHWINDISDSVQNWIKANPDKIIDFFDKLKAIDLKGFLKGAAEGVGKTIDQYMKLIEFFGGKDMEGFGRRMARAGFWGRNLNLFGGLLKGLRTPIAGLGAILAHIPSINAKLGGKGFWGFLGNLLGKGKDAEKVVETATATGAASKALIGAFKNFGIIAGMAGIAVGTGVVIGKGFKSMMNSLKDIVDTAKDIDWDVGKKALVGMAGFFGVFSMFSAVTVALPEATGFVLAGEVLLGAITGIGSKIAEVTTGNLAKAFNNFKSITQSLGEALDNLSGLKAVDVDKNAVQGAIDTLRSVYDLLKPQYQGQGLNNMSARQAGNMKIVVTDLVGVLKSLGELEGIAKDLDGFEVFSEDLAENVQNAFKSLGMMFDGFTDSFGLSAETNTKKASEITSNIKGMFDNLVGENGIMAQIKEVEPKLNELTDHTKGTSILANARVGMERMFTEIGNMFNEFASKVGMSTKTSSAKAKEIFENTKGTFDQLIGENGIIAQMISLNKELPKLLMGEAKPTSGGRTPIESVKEQLGDMFTAIGEIYESITSEDGLGLYTKVNEKSSKTVNDVLTNISDMFTSLIGENGLISQITALTESLPSLMGGGAKPTSGGATPMENVKQMLQDMFQAIGDLYTFINEESGLGGADMATFSESISQLPAVMKNIQAAVTTLQAIEGIEFSGEGGISGVIASIKQAIADLEAAFSAETIGSLMAQAMLFKASVDMLKMALSSIGTEPINIDITIVPTLTGADQTVALLTKAHDSIKKIRDNLAGLSMSINLSFPISASLPGLDGAIARMYSAARRLRAARSALNAARSGGTYASTGGYISTHGVLYRSGGGDVFRPRGTDVVPAMLTPGEYVMNRKATKTFGIDFMRKINNMDMQGALHELLTRAGGMASAGVKGTVINNNTYNNQRFSQTVHTNNPNFAMKMSSRVVGAF